MMRTLANQWDDPPYLDNRLLVILLISFSIFCYKLSIFGNFILQNIEVDLYTETLKLALFWLQNGVDLYTGSTYTPENAVTKTMDESISFFTAFINRAVQNISIESVGSHPNFNSIFSWLCWHILTEFQPTFETNHCFIDWNILLRIINSLDRVHS